MPPMVARLAVEMSGANRSACGRSCAFRSSSTTPGSTQADAFGGADVEHPVKVLGGVELQPGADRLAGL